MNVIKRRPSRSTSKRLEALGDSTITRDAGRRQRAGRTDHGLGTDNNIWLRAGVWPSLSRWQRL